MSRLRIIVSIAILTAGVSFAAQHESQRSAVVLDENVWVAFYDLPSRRFRDIRSALMNGNFESAARDLTLAASYVSIEADRSSDALGPPLSEVADQLRHLAAQPESIALGEFNGVFGRTHWLLAQHFIQGARDTRDARQNRATSLNLWAAAHHMERAILWSDVPISREVRKTLDQLRDVAGRLQQSNRIEAAYSERPVVRAEKLLRKIGKQIDRPVRLPSN